MAIHSFLKAEKGDPDWQFTPDSYLGKEFKIIDANTIEIDEGKNDQVILRQNPTEKSLLAKHLKVNLQKNSSLELLILNEVDVKIQQVFLYDIHLKDNASLSLGVFAKNGMLNKHIFQVILDDNVNFVTYGITANTVGGDTEIITKIIHQGEHAKNRQFFLGLSGKESQTVYQNINVVEPGGTCSEIDTESLNLILDEGGRCHSKQENWINAEYVKTAQRTETSYVDLEKISYLQSKGLSEKQAREAIVSGFKNIVLNLVGQESLCQEIKEMYAY